MQSMRQLKEQGEFLMMNAMTKIKQWFLVFGLGLSVGSIVSTQLTYSSIIKDCQTMGMFRYGNAPMSCTYHLVNIPVYDSIPVEKPKDKKK